ncbi:MAG: thiamine phosphate synthase [Gammaproteobacteria bacterium]|nr:thiamine phosphate synthase [Gammaproteobacteria bacterium]
MSEASREVSGLYGITPDHDSASWPGLSVKIQAFLHSGGSVLQYRNKSKKNYIDLKELIKLRESCRESGVVFIVNDDLSLAIKTAADGVHIGKEDCTLLEARKALPHGIIGVSCYNRLDLALEAQENGADYVAFGSFFRSKTKPQAVKAEIGLLRQAREKINLPIVAIGGITPENGAELLRNGAHSLAVINELFACNDVCDSTQKFIRLFH